jgi:O-antigen ligase
MFSISSLQALLIALILAGYPLSATFFTALALNDITLTIAVRALTLGIGLVLLVRFLSRLVVIENPRYAILFATFWLVYVFRMVIDTNFQAELLSRPASDYWIWSMGVCLVPALGLLGINDASTLKLTHSLCWAALATATALALLFGTDYVIRVDGTEAEVGRLALETLNSISTGHLGSSLAIVSGAYLLSTAQRSRLLTAASLAGIGAGSYLLVSAASRGPVVALLCVLILVIWSLRFHNTLKILTLLILSTVSAVLFFSSIVYLEDLNLMTRIVSASSGDDMAVSARQESYVGAWEQFMEHPLLGDFLEERSSGFYPHNLTLEAFMATGLIGGLAFLAVSLMALIKSLQAIQGHTPRAWLGMIYVQYLVGAQLSGSLYASATFWGFTVLMLFTTEGLESQPVKDPGRLGRALI